MDSIQNQRFKGKTPTDTTADQLTAAFFGRNVQTAPEIISGTSKRFFEKTALKKGAQGYRWNTTRFDSVGQLADHLKSGFAICTGALSGTRRQGCDVTAIHLLGADFDELGIDQLLKNSFVVDYAAIIYETASSTPTAPRSRALFILDTAITPAQFRLFIRRLLALFGQDADPRCTDPARIWYGSTNPRYLVREGVILPVSILAALPDPAPDQQPDAASNSADPAIPLELVGSIEALDTAIRARLGVTHFNADGWSNPVHCPFHGNGDIHPSAAWNEKGYLHCFACTTGAPGFAVGYYGRKHVGQHYGLTVKPTSSASTAANTLPNGVFERLNQIKLKNVSRVWEGLALAGYKPGQIFQTPDAIRDLPGIGSNTVRTTLDAQLKADADGIPLEGDRIISLFLHTPASPLEGQDYYVVSMQKQLNNPGQRGRPRKTYAMPSVEQLCIWLGVTDTMPGDAIDPTALSSGKAYRLAKHAAYMQRRDGKQAGMRLLSNRAGVSRRTIHDYNKAAGIEATPVYRRIPITWENLNALPFANAADVQPTNAGKRFVANLYIEDVTDLADPAVEIGKQYPPFSGIAADLLKKHRTIYLSQREINVWNYQPKKKTSAPIFKYKRVEAAQPVPLAKAAGAESMTPPPTSQWGHTPDDNGVSRLNPFSRKGHTHNDPDADHPPA